LARLPAPLAAAAPGTGMGQLRAMLRQTCRDQADDVVILAVRIR
jgi:hypothetical protein